MKSKISEVMKAVCIICHRNIGSGSLLLSNAAGFDRTFKSTNETAKGKITTFAKKYSVVGSILQGMADPALSAYMSIGNGSLSNFPFGLFFRFFRQFLKETFVIKNYY